MPKVQKSIYYLTGKSLSSVRDSPFLEVLKKKGLEVLLPIDPIDECAVTQLKELEREKLVSVGKDGLEFEEAEEEKKAREDEAKSFEDLCMVVKDSLGDRVEKIVISNHITDSPCVLGRNSNMVHTIFSARSLCYSLNSCATGTHYESSSTAGFVHVLVYGF
jgi:molecular chaperone HtpG